MLKKFVLLIAGVMGCCLFAPSPASAAQYWSSTKAVYAGWDCALFSCQYKEITSYKTAGTAMYDTKSRGLTVCVLDISPEPNGEVKYAFARVYTSANEGLAFGKISLPPPPAVFNPLAPPRSACTTVAVDRSIRVQAIQACVEVNHYLVLGRSTSCTNPKVPVMDL